MNLSRKPHFARPKFLATLFAVGLMFLLIGCSRDAPQNFLHPVGAIAKREDSLWRLTFGIAAVVFVLVEGALLFVIVRYRQKSSRDAPKQVHGNHKAEIAWTLIPVLLLSGIAVPTIKGIYDISAKPKDNPLEVTVIGHQWWWEYRYPTLGVTTANELHIPVGRPVYLTLESVDVIHSYWVPKLAGKQDVVPGRINHMTISSPVKGQFVGECVEYCGASHANMRNRVFADEASDFDTWVSDQTKDRVAPETSLAQQGEQVFVNGPCVGCHTVKGTTAAGIVGPNLTHFASRGTFAGSIFDINADAVSKWLANPPARKPGSKMPNYHLSQDDIDALTAYLLSLK
ncbi:MAG: cytochrome c oxidase subunit II [Actinomycetota bacterium]|nr:cytochrome c oxidase subunit II [Actinomycetota bacterium]